MSRLIDADILECVSATMPHEASEDYKEGYGDGMNYVLDIIDDLPTINPVKWIPVSERLPQGEEEVIANFRNEQIGRDRIGVSHCYVQKEGFFSDVPFEYKGRGMDAVTRAVERRRRMSDLISREAAIDAINQICQIDTEYDCTLLDRVDVRCVLTELPSAQPTPCDVCRHNPSSSMDGKPCCVCPAEGRTDETD